MAFLKNISLMGLGTLLFCCISCKQVRTTNKTDSVIPIRNIDVQEGALLPEEFNRVRMKYLNKGYEHAGWIFRYLTADNIVEYEDGWLFLGDKGEWGGILYWLDRNGKLEILIQNSDNPKDLVLMDEFVLVTWSPFLPLINSTSDVLRVRNTEGGFKIEKFTVQGAYATFENQGDDLVVKTVTPRTLEENYHPIQSVFSQVQSEQVLPPKLD